MTAKVEYRPEGDYVVVWVRGALHKESAAQMMTEWMVLVREHGCHRVLTDFQEAVVGETTTGMYEFVGQMEELGIPRDLKMASVATRDAQAHAFFETVARNQGWHYQLFNDLEAATTWLTQD